VTLGRKSAELPKNCLWILTDPWKARTARASHRSLDGAKGAPPTGPTGFTAGRS